MTDDRDQKDAAVSESSSGAAEHAQTASFHEGEEPPPPGVFAMSIVRWVLVLAMAVAAGASLLYVFGSRGDPHAHAEGDQYYCPMHPSVVQDQPGTCPICSMTLVKREASANGVADESSAPAADDGHHHEAAAPYYCPMHPERTGSSASDTCPICGMNLVPKPSVSDAPTTAAEAQRVGAPNGLVPIDLSSDRVQLIGMRTAAVVRGSLGSTLRAVGVIAPAEGGVTSVQTLFSGWIQELHVAETGQPVTRGQLLARIYSPELLSAQQELLNAKKWAQPGAEVSAADEHLPRTALLDNARSRLIAMGMQATEVAEVERSGVPHHLIEVRSPARGYIAEKTAVQGLYIQPGTQLFRIADLARVWALVDVFERDVGRVRHGQAAMLTLTAYPGETFRGRVDLIYPVLSGETRTLRVRVELKNPGLKLKPGMFGDVALEVPAADALLIPREALVEMGEHQYVFVARDAGKFEPRSVQTGARGDDRVEILTGLSEGETVVATGNFLLDSESRLRATIDGQKSSSSTLTPASACDQLFDRARFAEKYAQCRACETQHRGMGSMEEDCRNAIPKPWR